MNVSESETIILDDSETAISDSRNALFGVSNKCFGSMVNHATKLTCAVLLEIKRSSIFESWYTVFMVMGMASLMMRIHGNVSGFMYPHADIYESWFTYVYLFICSVAILAQGFA